MCLTEATAVARHDQRAQASTNDALRSSQRRLFKGACVLMKEGVDTVGRLRTAVPHYGLCGSETQVVFKKKMTKMRRSYGCTVTCD